MALDVLADLLKAPGTIKFIPYELTHRIQGKYPLHVSEPSANGDQDRLSCNLSIDDIVLFFIYLSHFLPLVSIGSHFQCRVTHKRVDVHHGGQITFLCVILKRLYDHIPKHTAALLKGVREELAVQDKGL